MILQINYQDESLFKTNTKYKSMKVIKSMVIIPMLLLFLTSFTSNSISEINGDECDVAYFYEAISPNSGTKVLTSSGELEAAELILVPTKIEEGTYKVEVTRKGSNIYKLEGTKYYIETRYCYEYATYDDAILEVESNYGYTKGIIYFK